MTPSFVEPEIRFPLRTKLSLFAGLLLVAHLLALGWVAVELTRSSVETSRRELQIAVIETIAIRVEQEFRTAQDGLELLGRSLTDDSLDIDARLSLASTLVTSNETLDNAVVFAPDGSVITPILEDGLDDLPLPKTLDSTLREQAKAEGVAYADAIVTDSGPRILIVVPMHAGDSLTGYAASLVTTSEIQAAVEAQAEAHFTDPRSALFIADENHRYIAHPNAELPSSLASAESEPALADLDIASVSKRFSKAGEFVNSNGLTLVGTIVGLPARHWVIVAQIPHDVAYAPVLALRRVVGVAVAIAIFIALISSRLLARRLTSPLTQLSVFARAIARREFDTRVDIGTSDELRMLGDVMTRAAVDLQKGEEKLIAEEAIRTDLRRYLPGELVDKVVKREQNMELGGERKDITVLFADVVAFTPLTQQHAPEEVVEILNELFTIITEIVFRHQGTVDKFIGDCVMAIWGAPNEKEDHAAAALEAAEEIKSWLDIGNARWEKKFGLSIEVAIGVNSGTAIVGNVGSTTRMEYTAIGETVNVAARLEALARPMQILLTEQTKDAAGDGFSFAAAGERTLIGQKKPITLWELI